jgi:hypothetical protein
MRYLELYESFESNNIRNDIEEILIELEDKGFIISGFFYSTHGHFSIFKMNDPFKIDSDITNSLLRSIDYLNRNEFVIDGIYIFTSFSSTNNSRKYKITNITEEGLFYRPSRSDSDVLVTSSIIQTIKVYYSKVSNDI